MKNSKTAIRRFLLVGFVCVATIALSGCTKQKADDFVKEQLEKVQAGDDATAEFLLEQGIEKVDGDYVTAFPEELKEAYCTFIKEACGKVQFHMIEAEKYNSGYKVRLEITPVDVRETVNTTDDAYVRELQSANLTNEVTALLEKDASLLEDAKMADSEKVTLYLKKKDSGYQIEESDWENCMASLLTGYMAPYQHVAEILDAGDYLKAYLDASCKGEVAQYAKHVGMTEEEVLQQYEESFTDVNLGDMEFTPEQETRFLNAMKQMFKNCQYEIGVPRKNEADGYLIPVKTTPNLSLAQCGTAFQTAATNGNYSTVEEVKEGYLSTMEEFADDLQ